MHRKVQFYKTSSGNSPIADFLDSLPGKVAKKITWALTLIEELEIVPSKYLKKIEGYTDIYECWIDFGGNTYRLLGFFFHGNFLVLTNAFMKKTKKIPKDEINLSIRRMNDYFDRGGKL